MNFISETQLVCFAFAVFCSLLAVFFTFCSEKEETLRRLLKILSSIFCVSLFRRKHLRQQRQAHTSMSLVLVVANKLGIVFNINDQFPNFYKFEKA